MRQIDRFGVFGLRNMHNPSTGEGYGHARRETASIQLDERKRIRGSTRLTVPKERWHRAST
jgi:hypothetical protein